MKRKRGGGDQTSKFQRRGTHCSGGAGGVRRAFGGAQAAGRREALSSAVTAPAGSCSNRSGPGYRRCSGAGWPTKTQTQTRCASPGWADPRCLSLSPPPRSDPRPQLPAWRSSSGSPARPRRPRLSATAPRKRRTSAGGGGSPGRLQWSSALLIVAQRAGSTPSTRRALLATFCRRLRAKPERRGSRRGSEGKGLAPSSLRGGYVAILDPRDKKIHAVSFWPIFGSLAAGRAAREAD